MAMHILVIAALAAGISASAAGTPERRYANASDEVVSERIAAMDSSAILEAGIRGKKDAVPALEKLATSEEPPKEILEKNMQGEPKRDARVKEYLRPQHAAARHAAKMALARMGETQYLKEFVDDLSSSDGWKRVQAIRALGYAGDKRAARYLGPILDEKGGPPKLSKHELAPSYSQTAEQALAQLFPDVQSRFERETKERRFFFSDEWKDWWKGNKDKYTEEIR